MSAVPHGPMGAIDASQRYTRGRPCPICYCWDGARRGKGQRCYGYLSADGLYAHCTREDYAGALAQNARTATYAHRLHGACKCGVTHGPALAASPRRSTAQKRRQGVSSRGSSERLPATLAPSDAPVDAPRADRGETRIQGREPEAVYVYTHADGTPAYRVERWRTVDTSTGELGKTFIQKRADVDAPGGWRSGLADTPRLPYRLRELASAPSERRVWIVEGEKCADALADALADVGELATCNSGGALHWRDCADVARATLAGRPVVILADNDGERPGKPAASYVGQRHALDVAASLADVAASVRVLMLPFLPIKGDVYDWLADGHTSEQLRALADEAPAYDPARPGVWYVASDEDWRIGAWWTPDGAPDTASEGEGIAQIPANTAPAPSSSSEQGEPGDELAAHRRERSGSSHRQVGAGGPDRGPDRGDTGSDTGEPGAPDTASVYTPIPGTSWYLASDGGPLMEHKGRGENAMLGPVYEWDAPTIRARVKFASGESLAGRAVLYDIELDGQRELISYGELHKGTEAWERWGSLGIAGRTAFANMAATVEYLARRAPIHRGMRYTGWVEHTATPDGEGMGEGMGEKPRHALVLPSGELIGRAGILPATRAYLDMAAHHSAAYRDADGEPIATPTGAAASPAAQAAALHFISTSAARSLAALATLAHVRSIMYGVWRSDCTVILRGGSGRGKTTVGKWGRNLVGDYGPNAPATAAFTGPTAASIEKHISQLKSLPIVLDDLVLRDDMTPGERADVGKKVDMVARSVANNEAIRQRQTAKMEDAPAYKVDALPILTAEELPPEVKASALNRSILLDIGEGDVQVARFYEDAATLHRAALRVFGRGFIVWLAGEWDTHGASLAGSWIDTHRAYAQRIERDMCAARGVQALPAYADRLPSNGAHLLLAAHALADYATRAGVTCSLTPEGVYSDLLAHLLAQVETIDALAMGGNDGEPIGERLAATIREALARGEAFVTNTDGTDAVQHIAHKPEELGYHAALTGDYTRGRVWLGELTPDGEYLTVERLALDGLLKHTARTQHWRGWRVSARELAATLHKAGLLVKSEDGRHIEHRVRRGGRRVWRLAIPCAALWPDYGEPGEGDTDSEPGELAPDGGAPEALADTLASPYSPDVVTHGGDAEDARERAGWGDEDADAAPYAPIEPDAPDDPPDGETLAPVGELHRRETIRQRAALADTTPRDDPRATPDARPLVHEEIG